MKIPTYLSFGMVNPEHLPSMHDGGSLSQEAETRSVGDVPKVASEWARSLIRSMKRLIGAHTQVKSRSIEL